MDLYVSAVKGSIVGRLGTGTATQKDSQIGVRYLPEYDEWEWNLEEVVVIPERSYQQHRRYYDKQIKAGALKVRDAAAFEAWKKTEAERSASEGKAQAERRKKELEEGTKLAAEIEKRDEEARLARRKMLDEARKKIAEVNAGKPAKPAETAAQPAEAGKKKADR